MSHKHSTTIYGQSYLEQSRTKRNKVTNRIFSPTDLFMLHSALPSECPLCVSSELSALIRESMTRTLWGQLLSASITWRTLRNPSHDDKHVKHTEMTFFYFSKFKLVMTLLKLSLIIPGCCIIRVSFEEMPTGLGNGHDWTQNSKKINPVLFVTASLNYTFIFMLCM